MKKIVLLGLGAAAIVVTAALAQTEPTAQSVPASPATAPAAATPGPDAAVAPLSTDAVAPPPSQPITPPKDAVLELRALDKITGKAIVLMAPLNRPVQFANLTITARTCYSTPASETPETSAFLQIDERRPDNSEARAFSGWMYASSPGLNSLQHPLYDVWVINCMTSKPGQAPSVVAVAPVKVVSPNAGANEAMPTLPEDAGQ